MTIIFRFLLKAKIKCLHLSPCIIRKTVKKIEVGSKIKVKNTELSGVVVEITPDGIHYVQLDNGTRMEAPLKCITPFNEIEKSNTQRDEKGQFVKGHTPYIANKRKVATARTLRKKLTEELEPFINNIGTIIAQIEEPQDQVLAITRLMKFSVPALSSIEYSEQTPRNLSAEEKLASLNAKYNNQPEPFTPQHNEDE